MTRLPRLLPALLLVSLAACSARVTGPKEAAPPGGEPHREPQGSASDPSTPVPSPSGGGESAGLLGAAPTLGRAGAEAPRGGLPGQAGADIVIDWDRVRAHAATDADFGVNVKRNDDTGGIDPAPVVDPAPAPAPAVTPADGAGNPH